MHDQANNAILPVVQNQIILHLMRTSPTERVLKLEIFAVKKFVKRLFYLYYAPSSN